MFFAVQMLNTCHRTAFAVRPDRVRCLIRFRTPPDQIAFGVRSGCVRRTVVNSMVMN